MYTEALVFDAIGTHWNIKLEQHMIAREKAKLLKTVQTRAEVFDKTYSRFRTDSLVTTIAQRAGSYALPEDGHAMLRLYERLYRATNGAVTPLVGQMMSDMGYDAQYSFRQKTLKRPPKWEDTLAYGMRHIELKKPALLDFGAAGKGYLVDCISELMKSAGIESFVIDASGDILHRSRTGRTVEVGLENPFDSSQVIGIARLSNQSLCASSSSKRRWGNVHHIMNPFTLKPVEDIVATWVIADDTITADGLATALFFASAQDLSREFSFSYAILGKDMRLSYSKSFPVQVFEGIHG